MHTNAKIAVAKGGGGERPDVDTFPESQRPTALPARRKERGIKEEDAEI